MIDEVELSGGRYSDGYDFADVSISNWNGRMIYETSNGAIPHIFLTHTDQDIDIRITKDNIEILGDIEQFLEENPDSLIAKSLLQRLDKWRHLVGHKIRRIAQETMKGIGQLDAFAKKGGGGHVHMSVSTPLGPVNTSNPTPKRTVEEELKNKKPTNIQHQTVFSQNQDPIPSTTSKIQQIVQESVSITPHPHLKPDFNPAAKLRYIEPSPIKFTSSINTPQHAPNIAGAMIESDAVPAPVEIKLIKEEEEDEESILPPALIPSNLETIAHPIRRTEETERIGSAARASMTTAVQQPPSIPKDQTFNNNVLAQAEPSSAFSSKEPYVIKPVMGVIPFPGVGAAAAASTAVGVSWGATIAASLVAATAWAGSKIFGSSEAQPLDSGSHAEEHAAYIKKFEETVELEEKKKWTRDCDLVKPLPSAINTNKIDESVATEERKKSSDVYAPDRPLPNTGNGVPIPDINAPHTQLGAKASDRQPGVTYPQAREFDKDGKPVRTIDFTDHGQPDIHPNPHQHRHEPNKTGGTPERKPAEPLPEWEY